MSGEHSCSVMKGLLQGIRRMLVEESHPSPHPQILLAGHFLITCCMAEGTQLQVRFVFRVWYKATIAPKDPLPRREARLVPEGVSGFIDAAVASHISSSITL